MQTRRIAIAYSCAIPLLLVLLLFELGALYRLDAHGNDVVKAAGAVAECDTLLGAFRDAETAARGYVASGSEVYLSSHDDAASRVHASLARLDESSKDDAAMQSKLPELNELSAKRLGLLQREIDLRETRRAAPGDAAGQRSSLMDDVAAVVSQIRAEALARSQREQASAAASLSTVQTLVKYGGVATVWIVAVAALLLFYDDSGRLREQLEHNLHTSILQLLPIGVCLTTESGVIIYVNRAVEIAFGYDASELVARNVALLHRPADPGSGPSVADLFAGPASHEPWAGELPIRTKDGDVMHEVVWLSRIRVGGKDCRLLLHGAALSGIEAPRFMPPLETAPGIADPPRGADPRASGQTIPPDSGASVALRQPK